MNPNESDAEERARRYANTDPFKSIPRALLSSAEIADYARATGMLDPFSEDQLKSASYEVHIGGEVIWWDRAGQKQKRTVNRGDTLVLEANSIVFAQVQPIFRLPNYIAIRFNLRITHVHRGLLLGTGPLVDPGFHGKLLIPLHNLTSTDYEIDTNEALIWVEFTKTTFGLEWPEGEEKLEPRTGPFKEFPPSKRNLTPEQYLRKANGANPIQSSISGTVTQAVAAASNAENSVATIKRFILFGAIGAVAAIGLSLYQIGQQFGSMVQNAQSLIGTLTTDAKGMTEKLTTLSADNKTLLEKANELEKANAKLNARVDELSTQLQRRSLPAKRKIPSRARPRSLTLKPDRSPPEVDHPRQAL